MSTYQHGERVSEASPIKAGEEKGKKEEDKKFQFWIFGLLEESQTMVLVLEDKKEEES